MSIAYHEPDNLAARPAAGVDALVRERIERWRSGQEPDAAAFLNEHPEVQSSKSLVLDLIYEEICLRSESGDTLVKSTFCDRFPAYRQSIVKMIEVKEYLDQCPPEDERVHRWPEAGEHFMGYDVVRPLGRGALARVYLAREPALGDRLVVIKVSRFGAREAQTLGRLSHANIVPVYSVTHDDATGWTVICMPLLGTATAVDLLDAAFGGGQPPADGAIVSRVGCQTPPINLAPSTAPADEVRQWRGTYPDAIARLGLQLAEGLEEAHASGIMHRDIKPSNVLLAWSGRPMLLDFNLSTDEAAGEARIGGTLAYMAPELIASLQQDGGARARRFDPRSDVYSLGVLLYELLTGHLPSKPDDTDDLPANAYGPWLESKHKPVPALCKLQPQIDRRLEAIVLKCLAVDPAQRYADAASLARELRSYLGVVPQVQRFVKRRPGAVLSALLGVFALLMASWSIVASMPSRYERLMATGLAQFERGELSEAEQSFQKALEAQPRSVEAQFALGMTLHQQGQWSKARSAFLGMESEQPDWMNILAGASAMQGQRWPDANGSFMTAYMAGNRHPGFLLQFAYSTQKVKEFALSLKLYAELLGVDPENVDGLRGRAIALLASSADTRRPIQFQAVKDARKACEIAEDLKSCHVAALIFAEARKVHPELHAEGTTYLKRAIELGLPGSLADAPEFQPFMADIGDQSHDFTSLEKPGYALVIPPDDPYPATADWHEFLRLVTAAQ